MGKITSIRIVHTSYGFQCGDDDSKHIIKIYRQGVVRHYIYNGVSSSPLREYEYKICNDQVVEFFRVLEEEIQIESWAEDYSVAVYDGYEWEFSIRYSDHHVKKHKGTVSPPPQGEVLENYINELVVFDETPWIF